MKKLIIVLIITAFVLGTLFLFKQKRTVDTTALPKQEAPSTNTTYKNESYGYSFHYPKDGVVKNYSDTNTNVIIVGNTEDSYVFNVNTYFEGSTFKSIQDWWIIHESPQNNRQAPYPDEEKLIKVGGEDAYYTVYDSESNAFGYKKMAAVFIYVGHNGKVYEISGGKMPAKPEERGLGTGDISTIREYEKTFTQMLESFQFIQ